MLCCARCFNKEHVRLHEFIMRNGQRGGPCDFCGTQRTIVIEPRKLRPLFKPLLSLYHPLETGVNVLPNENWIDIGESLATLVNEDFEVMSEAALPKSDELMEAIFTDGLSEYDISMMPHGFGTDTWWTSRDRVFDERSSDELWQYFAYYIRHKRRFILDEHDSELMDPRYLLAGSISKIEKVLPAGDNFYRGRAGRYNTAKEMGAPPHEMASAGRANPLGIPFLYLATDKNTVVAELRPWRGEILSIAEFTLLSEARVIDLTKAVGMGSPFDYGDADLYNILDTYRILWHLDEALSKPVDPSKAAIDYLPTQYITEVIRDAEYDGMIYKSALGPGKNLVLFSPKQAVISTIEHFEVTSISYGTSTLVDSSPSEE